jgi:hypothetical protein
MDELSAPAPVSNRNGSRICLGCVSGLDSAEAADAYVLYSARKGGFINDLCSDGYLPSEAAQAGRIEETTMMRYRLRWLVRACR